MCSEERVVREVRRSERRGAVSPGSCFVSRRLVEDYICARETKTYGS